MYCQCLDSTTVKDLNLIKKFLLPILVEDREIDPIVIKTANQLVSLKFGDVQLLGVLNFLGGKPRLIP